jgi:hypothetical protein
LEPTLYLFDGSNLFHAGTFRDRDELTDVLASFVAVHGARGVLVFDGVGPEREVGPLSVRFAPHADAVLERLAAENRDREAVLLVTSDAAVRGTSGQEVRHRASRRAGWATGSTRRLARGSSGSAAASLPEPIQGFSEHVFLLQWNLRNGVVTRAQSC